MMREVELQDQINKTAKKEKTKVAKGDELINKSIFKT